MPEKKEGSIDFNKLVVTSKDIPPSKGEEVLKAAYKLQIDSMQANVEPNYYWILDYLKKPGAFGLGLSGEDGRVEKLKDIYTAGISSAYWGAVEQRKGMQQEKVSTYLATIGKMLKDTFQIVREIRVIKERLAFYDASEKGDKSAEVALKGTWVDMVEGGSKNPSSVYGLASQVGFAVLPDLFFRVAPKTSKDVDKEVEKCGKDLGLNKKIQEVLSRKLKQFMEWKEKTYRELKQREGFVIKYLRQHYDTIKLYMNWVRPYLKNVRELQMQGESTDSALAKAFDTSIVELELLGIKYSYEITTPEGYKIDGKYKKYFPAIWVNIKFTAMPMMAYQQEYQRGAVHMGSTEITFKGIVITEDDLKKYKAQQDEEDLQIINSVFESMESLGEEFKSYLKEAGEKFDEKKETKEESEPMTLFTPFTQVLKGFKELFTAFIPKKEKKEEEKKPILNKAIEKKEKETAEIEAKKLAFICYDIYKKAHGMMAW